MKSYTIKLSEEQVQCLKDLWGLKNDAQIRKLLEFYWCLCINEQLKRRELFLKELFKEEVKNGS